MKKEKMGFRGGEVFERTMGERGRWVEEGWWGEELDER